MLLINENNSKNKIKLSSTKTPDFNARNTKMIEVSKITIEKKEHIIYTNSKGNNIILQINNKWHKAIYLQVKKVDKNSNYYIKQEAGYYKRGK